MIKGVIQDKNICYRIIFEHGGRVKIDWKKEKFRYVKAYSTRSLAETECGGVCGWEGV